MFASTSRFASDDAAQFLDRRWIDQGGQIAGILAFVKGADDPAHHFHTAGLRQFGDENQIARSKGRAEASDHGLAQFGGQICIGLNSRLRDTTSVGPHRLPATMMVSSDRP